MRNFLSSALRVFLSIGLLMYIFSMIDVSQAVEIIREANILYFIAALALFVVLYFIMLFRWNMIIRAMKLPVLFRSVSRYFWAGAFFNLVLPTASGGDVIKAIGLFQDTDKKTTVVASIFLDRFFGFIGVILLALISFVFGYRMAYDPFLLIVIIALTFITVVSTLFLFHEPLYTFACRIFRRFPLFEKKLMELHYAFVLLKDQFRVVFWAVFLSFIGQVILAFTFYLTARGLQQDVALIHCMVFVPLICIISLLPSLGGLGVRDFGSVFLFAKVGVSPEIAASMSLLNFIFMTIIGLGGAAFYVFTLRSRRI